MDRSSATPMQATPLLTPIPSAGPAAARPPKSSRNIPAGVLTAGGTLLLPVATFLPWYRDADGGGTFSAWGGHWFVIAGMLLLFLAGAWLAVSILAGRPLRGPAVDAIIALAFAVTITVVIALFIARPGGNSATAAAFGGYAGLAAIGTIKGGAILTMITAHRRVTNGPARASALRRVRNDRRSTGHALDRVRDAKGRPRPGASMTLASRVWRDGGRSVLIRVAVEGSVIVPHRHGGEDVAA